MSGLKADEYQYKPIVFSTIFYSQCNFDANNNCPVDHQEYFINKYQGCHVVTN